MNDSPLRPESVARIKELLIAAGVRDEDLREEFVCGSGSGGQKINKTSSRVVLIHAPSGIVVRCQRTRSRETNRWLARRALAEKIIEARDGILSARRAEAEKIRRQKRRRSRRAKAKMLADKHHNSTKKSLRKTPSANDE